MNYKVSVIIATYNTANYIEECLDSIFSQTLKDIEVIIIDDGSTDNTKEIVNSYQDKYPNLIYDFQENKGAGTARNYGIEISKGEYLLFMDPDDKYPNEDCVELLYNIAVKNRVDICGGNIIYDDRGVKRDCYKAGQADTMNLKNGIIQIREYYYIYGHTRYLFSSKLIKLSNVKFASYRSYEDQVFTMKAMGIAGKFYELDYPVYEYRINHKEIKIDYQLMLDIMMGFRDTVKVICDYGLKLMFDNNYTEFVDGYMKYIYKYAFCGNDEFDSIIYDINRIVKFSGWTDDRELVTEKRVKEYISNSVSLRKYLDDVLTSGQPIIIYGAGANTRKFMSLYQEKLNNVIGIAVTECSGNEYVIEGICVKDIEDYASYKDNGIVLITPKKAVKDKIIEKLDSLKFVNYRWVDMHMCEL